MSTILTLTKSAAKMFVRNRQSLFFTLFMPTVIMTIFGLIGFDRVPKIPVGVVATAPTPGTQTFIQQLKQVSAFDIKSGAEDDERKALENGDRSAVILLPNDLIPNGMGAQPLTTKKVIMLTNAGQAQQAQTALTILKQVFDKTERQITLAPSLFDIQAQEVNSKNLKYIDFLVPGIVALAIMQMAVFSVAFVFVDYKEKGILKRLLATPMKPYQFVTANVVTRLIVALVQAAILISIGVLVFKAHIIGSYFLIFLVTLLGAVMFLGLGFALSGLASTVEAVPALANLIVFPMLFLGGTFFPLSTMPDWLQKIAQFLPLTYFSDAMREVMINGASLSRISHDLWWMLGWAVVLIFLANLSFGFEEKRV